MKQYTEIRPPLQDFIAAWTTIHVETYVPRPWVSTDIKCERKKAPWGSYLGGSEMPCSWTWITVPTEHAPGSLLVQGCAAAVMLPVLMQVLLVIHYTSDSQIGTILVPGDICQCQEIFLFVMLWDVGRQQGLCWTAYDAQDSPHHGKLARSQYQYHSCSGIRWTAPN